MGSQGVPFDVFEVLHGAHPQFHRGIFIGSRASGLAAGLGIDLTFLRLNLAMFGQELSTEPGLAPTYNVILGVEFRL